MIVVKTIVRTLMFVVVVLFCVSTLHFYKIQANESLPTRPNFEHTNNQQFIDNVNQCIDYIYFYDKTVNKVDKDLLLAQAALESGWG